MDLVDFDIEDMKLDNIIGPYNKKKKRLGRGIGTGKGKTSGKGHKGQRARAGARRSNVFQGGQMPLERRLPKKGFTSLNRVDYSVLNLSDLVMLKEKGWIDESNTLKLSLLTEKRLVHSSQKLKLLAEGDINFSVTVEAHKASKAAIEKVEEAGGKIVLLG